MQESINAVLSIFKNMGFEAYYTGDKCRNEYISTVHKEALNKSNDIRIITNATIDDVRKIFPHAKSKIDRGTTEYLLVSFADTIFKIEKYQKHIFDVEKRESTQTCFENSLTIEDVKTLKENFERYVFTVDCIAQTEEGYVFGKTTESDIKNKLITTVVKNDKNVFFEYPIRCLHAFALMAETGFDIDKTVLKNIKSTMRYLRFYDAKLVGVELRQIISGKYALKALKAMLKIGILNSKCVFSIQNDEEIEYYKEKILFSVHSKDISEIEILSNFRINREVELEMWALLFDNADIAFDELYKFNCFNDVEMNTILWLINNRNLVKKNDEIGYRNDIFASISEFEKTQGIHHLKKLISHACHIFKVVDKNFSKEEKNEIVKNLMYNICCRPYFVNQLTWKISNVDKEKLIPILLNEEVYPFMDEDVDKFIEEHGCVKVGM